MAEYTIMVARDEEGLSELHLRLAWAELKRGKKGG